ncbi:MAG: ribonuclease Z [Thermoflexales bacterium]|nr:ribonuclease Z [Thermoflexales bacterium]MCS7324827.1 ribonuclease Z [Thermoflexales bacterium]MCX7938939.1 ribonuclease Z [Thermoflexales bacterium]MDW8054725.1 ribonuclease Z [Anaerolineae bacterium]MDW8293424.1 ribonuclease Z [Anaerolineae bacterium]
MFELTFLGTAASSPLPKRGLPSAIIAHDEYRFMVDCGEGTQRQLLNSGLGFRRLEHILLTHPHLDHILGLGGLLSTLSQWETLDKVTIYGGRSTLERVEDLLWRIVFRGTRPPLHIELIEVRPGTIFRGEDFEIRAFPVRHRGPDCFGFVFEEDARRPFLNDKATALGVPQGPERRELVRGNPITLADGRVIYPDDVLGEWRAGTKLVFTGDIGDIEGLSEIARNAHAIVAEATYLECDAPLARENGHITAAQAAHLARDANAKLLILNHISGRYRDKDLESEARAVFPNTVVARDFDTFKIKAE